MNFCKTKRFLFAIKDVSDDIDGNDANAMVYQSCVDALDELDDDDRARVEREAKHLMDCVPRLGYKGALEILASVAEMRE